MIRSLMNYLAHYSWTDVTLYTEGSRTASIAWASQLKRAQFQLEALVPHKKEGSSGRRTAVGMDCEPRCSPSSAAGATVSSLVPIAGGMLGGARNWACVQGSRISPTGEGRALLRV